MISSWTYFTIFIITVTSITSLVDGSSVNVILSANKDSPIHVEDENISKLEIVEREEWEATPSSEPLKLLDLPVQYVFISHTASEFCYSKAVCSKIIKFTQKYHMQMNKWSDIAYNFLVGGDGLAYVGRGWDYQGAHTFHYNNISIGITFIGTFNSETPTENQLQAAQKLIELGVKLGKIREDYVLLGHRQVAKTMSPGDVLYGIIQTWPHWSIVTSTPGEPISIANANTSFEGFIETRIVSREEWEAVPSSKPLQPVALPVKYVIISHTDSNFCYSQLACIKHVRLTQLFHMESLHFSDIGYNFLVGGDGRAYVGRDWDYEGAHTRHFNNISTGISFIGNFNSETPTPNQLEAAQKLIEIGVKSGKIREDYVLLGHRQVSTTLSPGDALYRIIQTWSHWTPKVN